ncbi:MAG: hypothetical protein EBT09_11770 [Actinobacteria bacterium]|nr:hypothetical protein [Actinomycetota bacterium]
MVDAPPAGRRCPGISGTFPPHEYQCIPCRPLALAGGAPPPIGAKGVTVDTAPVVPIFVEVTEAVGDGVGVAAVVAVPLATASAGAVAITGTGADVTGTSVMEVAVATGDTLATADTITAGVAAGVAVATICPDAAGTGPNPPTMLAMTSMAGTANRNQLQVNLAISSSFGTTLGERIN